MTYRKIEVNNVTYEYVVGRSNIKIKGVGVYPKPEARDEEDQIAITPSDIRKLILENV